MGRRAVNPLRSINVDGAGAQGIADAAVAVWAAIDGALSPVIGTRGNAALYKRTLHLARAQFPWLAAAYEGAVQPGDYSALRAALAQQTATDASQAHDALLRIFNDLLADLIGRSLTKRLLQAAWSPNSYGNAVQDDSP
ncbi:MAG: hypothetical protein K0Q43_4256 [Ramlibacter sp.]|jgi:hypothetical protein|nr:hypothetical protein [Ramlibacter sp.]